MQQMYQYVITLGKNAFNQMDRAFDRDPQGFIVNALIIFIIVILLNMILSYRKR